MDTQLDAELRANILKIRSASRIFRILRSDRCWQIRRQRNVNERELKDAVIYDLRRTAPSEFRRQGRYRTRQRREINEMLGKIGRKRDLSAMPALHRS